MDSRSKISEQIARLLDASLAELSAMEFQTELAPAIEWYRKVLVAFTGGDAVELDQLSCLISENTQDWAEKFTLLPTFTRLRLELFTHTVTRARVDELKRTIPEKENIWRGEYLILLATAEMELDELAEAITHFKQAALSFHQFGIAGKALRARFNAAALVNNIHPEKKMISEFFFLYRESRKFKQTNIMATSLLNISREYHKVGALKMALKFVNKAIAAASAEMGGQIYFLAIAHRAHLFFELNRQMEAKQDFEEASTSSFPAVKGAWAVLEKLFFGDATACPLDESKMPRTWRERLDSTENKKPQLSANEEKLIHFLSGAPRDKFEIIEHLFGIKIDLFAGENRLKSLIHRLRKKSPGMILFENEKYFLAHNEFTNRKKGG